MADDRYRFEALGSVHDRAAFSCGVEALDRYLHRQAEQDLRRRVAAVFVLYDTASSLIVGYYALSSTAIDPAALPPEVTRRWPRYPSLPAVLLGRLAVDRRYRGGGFGRRLLLDALRRALAHADQVAAIVVVVNAKDDAARNFYERYGFRPFVDDQNRLFIPMETITEL